MRKLLLASLLLTAVVLACQNKTPSGPGVVKITETTTTTSFQPAPPTTTVPIATEAKFTFSPITPEECQGVNFNGSDVGRRNRRRRTAHRRQLHLGLR
jgi:hypothetical protein